MVIIATKNCLIIFDNTTKLFIYYWPHGQGLFSAFAIVFEVSGLNLGLYEV